MEDPYRLWHELQHITDRFPIDYATAHRCRAYSEGKLRVLEDLGLVRLTRTGIELCDRAPAYEPMDAVQPIAALLPTGSGAVARRRRDQTDTNEPSETNRS